MRSQCFFRCLASVALSALASIVPASSALGASSTREISDDTARPLGPITIIGDSVMLGSLSYGPTLVDTLANEGWGPIRARGGMGYSSGYLGVPDWGKTSVRLEKWRAEGWDAPNIIVNIGVNDAGLCGANVECSIASIDFLLDSIGPGHTVWWPNITRSAVGARDYQSTWNAALDAVAARRSELIVWDWETLYMGGGFPSGDRIHLSPDGYRERNRRMATAATEDLVRTVKSGQSAALPAPVGEPGRYSPIEASRILDTRSREPLPEHGIAQLVVPDAVPATATAIAINLTSTQTSAAGFLTAYACASGRPNTSNVNHEQGRNRGGFAIVQLDSTRELCIYSRAGGHVIVDIQGWFGSNAVLGFDSVEPQRIADTRQRGRVDPFAPLVVDIPVEAEAVAVTLTVTGAEQSGYLSAAPCSTETPNVSNLNYGPRESVAGSAYVASADGSLCIVTSTSVDVIVDLTGVFGANGHLVFQPVMPTRLLDTRSGVGGWGPLHQGEATIELPVAPEGAEAISGSITIVNPTRHGYLTAHPCGTFPSTSSVNAAAQRTRANMMTIAATDGSLCITSSVMTHTLFDLTGWWITADAMSG